MIDILKSFLSIQKVLWKTSCRFPEDNFCIILQNNGNPENSIKTVSSGCYTPRKARIFRHFQGLYYGVTTSLIVISSKSDTFFERHLPGRHFVPSPPIRHFPSFSGRDFLLEPSSNRAGIPIRPHRSKPLCLCGVWDVSASVAWVYYKAKGHRKSLML